MYMCVRTFCVSAHVCPFTLGQRSTLCSSGSSILFFEGQSLVGLGIADEARLPGLLVPEILLAPAPEPGGSDVCTMPGYFIRVLRTELRS